MQTHAFLAVLFSAFFQAGWNFKMKASRAHRVPLVVVGWFILGLCLVPIAMFSMRAEAFDPAWWKFILSTACVHALYICFLGWAYALGEISVVYPVSRGLGIVGTAAASAVLGLHEFSTRAAVGIACVVCGTLCIGMKEVPRGAQRRKGFFVAMLVASTVASYSIIDSLGARHVPLLVYLASMHILPPLFAAPYLAVVLRKETLEVVKEHKREGFMVAFAGMLAYSIVLWAFRSNPPSYVATVREFSVVIASGLGIFFLKEELSKRKVLGIVAIVAGIVLVKLA